MLLGRLVETSAVVGAASARNAKTAALADLLGDLEPEEIAVAVGLLSSEPRQGRIGVGYRTLAKVDVEPAGEPSLQILDVDRALTELQATTGSGSVEARRRRLVELFGRATAEEREFLHHLIGGELRQGALAGVMTAAIAKGAAVPQASVRRALMLSGNLGRTAEVALTAGKEGLADVALEVLRPVQPMLASTADGIGEAIGEGDEVSVEWKLDGIRVQVHRSGPVVKVFTRNLNDVTDQIPEVVALARSFDADAFVLDGEAIGFWGGGGPEAFQDTASAFSRRQSSPERHLTAWFFDILHLDGRDLIDLPLVERRVALGALVGDRRIPAIRTGDPVDAQTFFDAAVADGHEGVMVKAVESVYEAGRRGKAWRKVKPVHTLDLVVLGAEWGHGRRQGWLSNLHLGARDPDTGGFVMVGKTFKGLTDELLTWQTERFLELEVRRDGIAVLVRPEIVVEIALDGAQTSTRYPGGVALRFARVKRYRADKDPIDVDDIETVRAMR